MSADELSASVFAGEYVFTSMDLGASFAASKSPLPLGVAAFASLLCPLELGVDGDELPRSSLAASCSHRSRLRLAGRDRERDLDRDRVRDRERDRVRERERLALRDVDRVRSLARPGDRPRSLADEVWMRTTLLFLTGSPPVICFFCMLAI